MNDVTNIREKALVVKNATQEGENTAERIGGLFVAVAEKLAEIPTSTEIEDKVKDIIDDMDMSQYAPAYDDTAIKEKIAELNEAVTEANNTITSQTSRLDSVTEEINTRAASIQSNLDEEVEAIGTHISDLTSKYDNLAGQHTVITKRVGELELQVASIEGGGGSQDSEALISTINAAVDNKVASLDLETVYSKTNDVGKILEWMYSGMKESTSASKTYAELVSAAKNNTLGNSAIAGLQTQIDNLGNTYVATSQLNTKVNDAIASLVQSVDPNASVTSIINQVGANKGNISSIISRVSSLEGAGYLSETDIVNALGDSRTNIYSSVNSLANTAATGVLAQWGPNTIASALTQATDENAIAALQAKFGSTIEEGGIDNLISERLKAYATGTELQQVASTASSNSSAIGSLEQRTQALEGGNFVSSSEVWNIVKDNVEDTISSAGYVSTSDFDSAKQTLQSSIDSKTTSSWVNTQLASYLTQAAFEAITGLSTTEANAVSGLMTRVKDVEDSYVSQAALLTSVEDKFLTKYQSGIVSQATLTNAVAGLVAEKTLKDDYVAKASVITSINESGESNVKIDADKIDINGVLFTKDNISNFDTEAANAAKGAITAEYINALNIVAKKLAATEGTIGGWGINSSGIYKSGTNTNTYLNGTYGTITLQDLSGGYTKQLELTPDGLMTKEVAGGVGDTTNEILTDGSGFLARGAISWDANGNISQNSGTIGGWSISERKLSSGTGNKYIMLEASETDPTITAQDMQRSCSASLSTSGFSTRQAYKTSGVTTSEITCSGTGFLATGAISWDADGNITLQKDDDSAKVVLGSTTGITSNSAFTIQSPAAKLLGGAQNGDNFTPLSAVKCEGAAVDISSNGGISASCLGKITASGGQGIELTGSGAEVKIESGSTYIQGSGSVQVTTQGSFYSNVALTVTSDERKKTIVDSPEASIEDIAEARVVDYYLNSDEDKHTHLGSIAQDWQKIYPHAVVEDAEGYLGLDYSSVALASVVTAAREIVALRRENQELKARLEAVERKLSEIPG